MWPFRKEPFSVSLVPIDNCVTTGIDAVVAAVVNVPAPAAITWLLPVEAAIAHETTVLVFITPRLLGFAATPPAVTREEKLFPATALNIVIRLLSVLSDADSKY